MNNCVLIVRVAKKVEERQAQLARSEINQYRPSDYCESVVHLSL